MLKEGILDSLYAKRVNPAEFNFETLTVPSLYNYISEYEIGKIYDVVTSVKYSDQLTKKKQAIKSILSSWGFTPFASGTNRMCFRYLENKNFIVKLPYKISGLDNGMREYRNQMCIKPFVSKTFDVHPSGIISQHERVLPITNREEYMSVINDVFAMLTAIIGKYILDDVGTKYFMNIGIRPGFGVVILDYPDLFEVDGKKLFCNRPVYPNTKFPVCGGLIDYDAGFNTIVCKTCGKEYSAASLQKEKDNNLVIMEGEDTMSVRMLMNGKVIAESDGNVTNTIVKPKAKVQKIKRPKVSHPSIFIRGEMEEPVVVEEYVEKQPTNTQKIRPTNQVTRIEQKPEPKVEEPKKYAQEQTSQWIRELVVDLQLTDEVLATADATLASEGKSFNDFNRDELEIFLHNVNEVIKARHEKARQSQMAKDIQATTEVVEQPKESPVQDEDPVYEDVVEEESNEEDNSAIEPVEESENENDEDYATSYSDDYTGASMISEHYKNKILEVIPSSNDDDESLSTGSTDKDNNKPEAKQEDNKQPATVIPSTFIIGADTSQY